MLHLTEGAMEKKISSFCSPCIQNVHHHFFTNSIIFFLKNGKTLYHVYVSLPVPCTAIITISLIPFFDTIYGMPEISLHVSNSPIIASFKFSIASPFLNYSSWWPVRTQSECTGRPPQTLVESESIICCMHTIVSS